MWNTISKLTGSPGGAAASPGRKVSSPFAKRSAKSSAKEDPLTSFVTSWESIQAALSSSNETKLAQLAIVNRNLSQLAALLASESASTLSDLSSSTSQYPHASSSSSVTSINTPLGPCHEFLINNAVPTALVALAAPDNPQGVRKAVVLFFRQTIGSLKDGFLVPSAVHRPLLKLLRSCVEKDASVSFREEEVVVELVCQICESIEQRPDLLTIFFHEASSQDLKRKDHPSTPTLVIDPPASDRTRRSVLASSSRSASPTPSSSTLASSTSHNSTSNRSSPRRTDSFLLFDVLLRFVHREGRVGDLARTAILHLVDVACRPPFLNNGPSSAHTSPRLPSTSTMTRSDTSSTVKPLSSHLSPTSSDHNNNREGIMALAEYLVDSDFADVLGAGLGALYGLLPGKLLVRPPGSSPSSSGGGGTESVAVEVGSVGMVLGGMGALELDEDPEETERKRQEEEDRLQVLGVAVSGTEEFRDGIDSWLKLVEFTQDVVDRGDPRKEWGHHHQQQLDELMMLDGDAFTSERGIRLVVGALASSILTSLKRLFLPVLYTSILECSESDGSAVAVLSYLEAMLDVVREGTELEAAILGFLMASDDSSDLLSSGKKISTPSSNSLAPAAAPKRVRRRKSSALVLIEAQSPTSSSASPAAYFSSLGRFSLQDLLVSTIHSSSSATSTASLKLLRTLLTRHDRWSMGLLDIVLDQGATYFPSALREPPPAEDDIDDDEVPGEDDDSEVFVYPSSPATPGAAEHSNGLPGLLATPHRGPGLVLGNPLPSTPSLVTHLDSLETLMELLEFIDPSVGLGGDVGALTASIADYVRDAEAAIALDPGFQRGIALDAPAEEPIPMSPQARRRSTLFGSVPTLTARDFAGATTSFRHRLTPKAKLPALLLESLSEFFSHSPDLNLSLTAALSALALCPYRSLEGWMLSPPPAKGSHGTGLASFAELAAGLNRPRASHDSDDGDDRSVDYNVDDICRHEGLFSPSLRGMSSETKPPALGADSVLSIVAELAQSITQYRSTIPNFDKYLSERRAGLHFVDDLADALNLNDGFQDFATSITTSAADSSGRFGDHLVPAQNPYATPTRPSASELRRQPSVASFGSTDNASRSPFAAHYRQTGSIQVTPVLVGSARKSAAARLASGHGVDDDDDEEDDDLGLGVGGGPTDSPTRRLSPAVHATSSARSQSSESRSETSNTTGSSPLQGSKLKVKQEAATVTLSATLDNVLVLEEFLKELTAIVLVRRGLGIDRITFL
ncbi:hypothetical protein T439DRAFT_376284 [Meredithblackwellia eburnea MCA 4105]